MERIVIFGKGGIGKSTIAANLSVTYARRGMNVLHVGCDPKHDSTVALVRGNLIETFMEKYAGRRIKDREELKPRDFLVKGSFGIDCVEAGGPEPGVGCAGRGISLMLEAFQDMNLFNSGRYDVGIFDVLGDVVCGGFAAPLRKGIAEKIVIVISMELMSLYAANNIAKAVRTYASNGVCLAGLAANCRSGRAGQARAKRFAKLLGTDILEFVPHDPAVRRAESFGKKTAVELAPGSPFARSIKSLAGKILAVRNRDCPVPSPMDDRRFYKGW